MFYEYPSHNCTSTGILYADAFAFINPFLTIIDKKNKYLNDVPRAGHLTTTTKLNKGGSVRWTNSFNNDQYYLFDRKREGTSVLTTSAVIIGSTSTTNIIIKRPSGGFILWAQIRRKNTSSH